MKIRLILALFITCIVFPGAPRSEQFADVLIRGGRVLDGTRSAVFQRDVAIKDGRILAVGDLKEMQANKIIDALGYYVTPGFIDMHSHACRGLSNPHLASAINNVTQGITTVVVGQDGRHAWPVGSSLAQQVKLWRSQGVGNNVIPLVGHGSTRLEVMGWDQGRASPEQAAAIANRVKEDLKQGAWGISTGLSYIPGRYASTEEVIEATRPVREIDGFYISHLRDQGDHLLEAIEEMLRISEETGVRVVATHIKSAGRRNWGGSRAAVKRISKARRQGIPAYADLYPYETSSDGVDVSLVNWMSLFAQQEIQSWLPPVEIPTSDFLSWVYRVNPTIGQFFTIGFVKQQPERTIRSMVLDGLLDRLRSEEVVRQRLREVWADPQRRHFLLRSVQQRIDWPGGAELFRIEKHPDESLVGLTLAEAALIRDVSPAQAAVQLTLEGAVFTQFHMSEEDIITFIQQPYVAGCTDGWVPEYGIGMTHPRSYGAFTRRLRRYVYELNVIDLPLAIHTATGLPAEIIGLKDRGYIKVGQWADLIVFDPRRVRDRATFRNPHQYSEGIEWVFINGEVVVENGK
ncbi:amidohydrolase family protein, partial [Acidobacteria bacterium AH-259-O06]|nr:amidohydrolase family protein [Acidobacteria bacterium AH-259-O06]